MEEKVWEKSFVAYEENDEEKDEENDYADRFNQMNDDQYEDLINTKTDDIEQEPPKEYDKQDLFESKAAFNREKNIRKQAPLYVPEDMADHPMSKVLYQKDEAVPGDDYYSNEYIPNIFQAYRGGLPKLKKKPSPPEKGMLGRPAYAAGAGPEFVGNHNSLLEDAQREVETATAMQAKAIKMQAWLAKGGRGR